jgi:hypothetical protein
VTAYCSASKFFSSLFHPLTHIQIENEISSELTAFFQAFQPRIHYQCVPPNNHRANKAERSIRTGKKHFLSVFSSDHITFTPDRWCDLLPATELTLNTMRLSALDPSMSAWYGLHGSPVDFSTHPIHPPGQLMVVHDSPLKSRSWAHHGVRAFYISPSLSHYRSHTVFVPRTGATCVSDILDHFPDPLFPFEDHASDPVLPDPSDLPNPSYDGIDLAGREVLDPDLGVCQIIGPDAPLFSSSCPKPAIARPDATSPQVGTPP